jgi:hypothetical protein
MTTLALIDAPRDLALRSAISAPPRVTLQDRAFPLITDFRNSPIVTIGANVQIDRAVEHMIAAGVRLCFVTDAESMLVGTVTSYDIQGEAPMRYLLALGPGRGSTRRDVLVRHVMEPLDALKVIDLAEALRASIGEVVAAMKTLGRRHLIVVERSTSAPPVLRGVFSATRFERETGWAIDVTPSARTFAEIERAVEHPE